MRKEPENILANLVDSFIKIRKAKGLSHEQLAQSAGISRSAVSLIEDKKRIPTITTALKIAHALGKRLSDLLDE